MRNLSIMKTSIKIRELISSIHEQHIVQGNLDGCVRTALPIDQADKDSISYCRFKDERAQKIIGASKAKVIICSDELELSEIDYKEKTIVRVSNPRLTYCRILSRYFLNKSQYGIHPTAVIDKRANISDRVYIGPLCNIGNCEIGNDTVIESHVYIHSSVKIGERVTVQPGAIIGVESIAYERNEENELVHFPQLGIVTIEDDVLIGTNDIIARGPLPRSATIIGKGTKLGSSVIVGHGVKIGKHCMLVGHSTILGSVNIGSYTYISSHVCVKQGVNVGSRVVIGMSSTVLSDVPDNVVVVGTPAKQLRENVL
jgi:UDP-3-O-[3-hydroxymyristoyl] glucosamine N-acyltransferase